MQTTYLHPYARHGTARRGAARRGAARHGTVGAAPPKLIEDARLERGVAAGALAEADEILVHRAALVVGVDCAVPRGMRCIRSSESDRGSGIERRDSGESGGRATADACMVRRRVAGKSARL